MSLKNYYNSALTISASLILSLTVTSCSEQKTENTTQAEARDLPSDSTSYHHLVHTQISSDTPLAFNEHIQPILSANCYHCHGPDSGTRYPEDEPLRLDSEEGAFQVRQNGKPVIIKGDPDNSYLIELMESKDPELVMPVHPSKDAHGKIMDPADIALVRRWVKEGANFEKHWAYITPEKSALPEVKNKAWVRNPIDYFVLNKLEKNNLTPNQDEDKARLLRRLTLDITGLTPTPQELATFLADTRDFETVYADKVNHLLNSDAYAENFARHWLDVARYADTHGIHIDNYRSIWPYRDWVINAFRSNMKFDQFTIEQIAGDMLPNATLDQKIATGFHRCLPTTGEGGAIAEEYNAIYAQDRVDTTSSAWLGLTAGCAACHDHKFDAISTKENYQLTAFFRNTTMSALDRNNSIHPPNLLVPLDQDRQKLVDLNLEKKKLIQEQIKFKSEHESSFQKWLTLLKNTPNSSLKTIDELIVSLPLDNEKNGINHPSFTSKQPLEWKKAPFGDAVIFTKNNEINLGNSGDFESDQAFSFGAWINPPKGTNAGIISKMDTSDSHRGYDLWLEKDHLAVHLIHNYPQNYIKVTTRKKIKVNQWSHVMVTYDGSQKPSGIKLYVDGVSQKLVLKENTLTKSIKSKAPFLLGSRYLNQPFTNGQLQYFKLYGKELTSEEVNSVITAIEIKQLANKNKFNQNQLKRAKNYYFSNINKDYSALESRIQDIQHQLNAIEKRGVRTLIMDVNHKKKPTAHVLIRGDYTVKDKEVLSPDVPAALPPMTDDMPRNRLGLAMWLTDKKNPLPARVTANRYWSYFFGRGITDTNKDFGVMGARPTHPKLLDYIAADFMEHDWDLHHLIREIVTSSTYRQSAIISPEKKAKDPLNKLLSRGPRYRLDAEQLRDLALSSSNLLHPQVGGPSVKPYQPINIWESVAMSQSNTRHYKQDSGDKLYRRSIYTFWKRTAPHPAMEILNAPAREESCVQREVTNTPLQAFVLMNDPQFVEASRKIATSALLKASSTEDRLNIISTALISREMNHDEVDIVKTTLKEVLKKFEQEPEQAQQLISVGESNSPKELDPSELAAWTVIANQILNMDETLNK